MKKLIVEPRLDDTLGNPHPDQIAAESPYCHQRAHFRERCARDAVADYQHIAQGGEEADEGEPDAPALQEVLHVADLGLLDLDPMLYPVERGKASDQVVGRCAQPVAEEDPAERRPMRPAQRDGCTEGHLAAHGNTASGNEAT